MYSLLVAGDLSSYYTSFSSEARLEHVLFSSNLHFWLITRLVLGPNTLHIPCHATPLYIIFFFEHIAEDLGMVGF